ncbi:flavin monoamine oxidase family protein [Okibacterium endophyticum]
MVEGRDRIGGRTWLDSRMGLDLEMGGTWVHWTQPYVWAELRRYGLGVAPSPIPQHAFWWNGQAAVSGSPDELFQRMDRPNRILTEESRTCFPQPFAPFAGPDLTNIDTVTLADRIVELDLSDEERSLLSAFWTLNFNGRLEHAALTQALRWVALANGDWAVTFEACSSYKIEGGTRNLASHIAEHSTADLLLNADVREVLHVNDSVKVTLADGRTINAATAIVTAPLHALGRIAFHPPLPPARTSAIGEGQLGLGVKVWIRIEGEHAPFVALGDASWPLTFFQSEYVHDEHTYVIGFGPDAHAIDTDDRESVQAVLRRLVPDAVVVDIAAHDWVADEYSGETWPMHRAGYLTNSLRELQSADDGLNFAGSDIADGWGGFIDGAIESGLTAAARTARVLAARTAESVARDDSHHLAAEGHFA